MTCKFQLQLIHLLTTNLKCTMVQLTYLPIASPSRHSLHSTVLWSSVVKHRLHAQTAIDHELQAKAVKQAKKEVYNEPRQACYGLH